MECARILAEREGPALLSPFVLAELDCLVAKLANVDTALQLLQEAAAEAYTLAAFVASDLQEACSLIERHSDLGIGLADASIVVIARRHRTREILILDEGRFAS